MTIPASVDQITPDRQRMLYRIVVREALASLRTAMPPTEYLDSHNTTVAVLSDLLEELG